MKTEFPYSNPLLLNVVSGLAALALPIRNVGPLTPPRPPESESALLQQAILS